MVSEQVQQVIQEVFPNVSIRDNGDNGCIIFLDKISDYELLELAKKTVNWSGCSYVITSDADQLKIHFWHTVFCN